MVSLVEHGYKVISMRIEEELKRERTKEEEKSMKVDNPNHPSKHKNDKDLLTAEELEEYFEGEGKVDTTNLGS